MKKQVILAAFVGPSPTLKLARKMASQFPDSQETLVLGEATLTDSDVEVDSKVETVPAAKKPKIGFVMRPATVVTDSEDEDDLVELSISDSVVAPPKVEPPSLEDKPLKFAEVFSGAGILSKHMKRLGFTTQKIDYLIGGQYHDISDYVTVTCPSLET